MIDKTRILYKGDMLAASFYVLIGCLLAIFAIVLHYFTTGVGFFYLKIGFCLFCIYCLGKGVYMYWIAKRKYEYFTSISSLTNQDVLEETVYTQYRIDKKFTNRRRYIYTVVIACILAFIGVLTQQKGFILGTCIPIALIAGIELGVGLLTEFRLREYKRLLQKQDEA